MLFKSLFVECFCLCRSQNRTPDDQSAVLYHHIKPAAGHVQTAVLSPPQRVLSHGPAPLTPGMALPLGSHAPPGSLKVPPPGAWGSPVHPAFRLGGASSSQLVTVLATPRPSSPTRTLREAGVPCLILGGLTITVSP
eukprot:g21345.t1